jgi:hypothetical protein
MIAESAAASWKRMHSRWRLLRHWPHVCCRCSSSCAAAGAAPDLFRRVDDISLVVLDIDFTQPWRAVKGVGTADGSEDGAVLFAF